MVKVSATKLRNNLFEYLDKAAAGEIIVIQRNNQEVARLIPTKQTNWRDKMHITPELLVPPDEFIKPIEDIWENYV
ncbi:MAG TPA: type II toxin-antitoxin system prevent-host-death family antitoxin [Anaerolineae bacterium]|nr:type II toxin-antitoxin system prevent-host-death family antitoxin [Anaerolineae bacterium]